MPKVAKLVTIVLKTRIIVDEDATEEECVREATEGFKHKVNNEEIWDNLEKIEDDEEVPYSEEDEVVTK